MYIGSERAVLSGRWEMPGDTFILANQSLQIALNTYFRAEDGDFNNDAPLLLIGSNEFESDRSIVDDYPDQLGRKRGELIFLEGNQDPNVFSSIGISDFLLLAESLGLGDPDYEYIGSGQLEARGVLYRINASAVSLNEPSPPYEYPVSPPDRIAESPNEGIFPTFDQIRQLLTVGTILRKSGKKIPVNQVASTVKAIPEGKNIAAHIKNRISGDPVKILESTKSSTASIFRIAEDRIPYLNYFDPDDKIKGTISEYASQINYNSIISNLDPTNQRDLELYNRLQNVR